MAVPVPPAFVALRVTDETALPVGVPEINPVVVHGGGPQIETALKRNARFKSTRRYP